MHSYSIAVLGYGLVHVHEQQRALTVGEELQQTRLVLFITLRFHDGAVETVRYALGQTLVLSITSNCIM